MVNFYTFMGFFLLSLLFCGIFGFGFLLILQYIFITFQNRRLAGEIITKKVLALPSFGQTYSRALMVLTARDKPIWLTRIILKMDKIWQNISSKLTKLTKYFKTLATKKTEYNKPEANKPKIDGLEDLNKDFQFTKNKIKDLQNIQNLQKSQNNLSKFRTEDIGLGDDLEDFETENSKNKINPKDVNSNFASDLANSNINSKNTTTLPKTNPTFGSTSGSKNPSQSKVSKTRKPLKTGNIWDTLEDKNIDDEDEDLGLVDHSDSQNQTATIGMVGNSTKNREEMTPFEKQEEKIVKKLQTLQENNLGLNHWDLWLELGDLYGKYAQKDKQKEVYTFILGNADNSDKEKELATFRLIGMN